MAKRPPTLRPMLKASAASKRIRDAKADRERGTAHERGYNSRWRKARLTYLSRHPLCAMCEAAGRVTPATVVDHITPHRGDTALFWDTGNWQSLCKRHHDSAKQRQERQADVSEQALQTLPALCRRTRIRERDRT